MAAVLAGIETEYGLQIEGRRVEDQVEDSAELVRCYPGPSFEGWDYRDESPRADLRGFTLNHLAHDPEDARFDQGRSHRPDRDLRADRVLANGARLYNDHGHPEYATPECWSLRELALHEKAGEIAVWRSAEEYTRRTGRSVRLFKNNTDYHGASYGTHESYLVRREVGFERLFAAVTPMLIARQILTGAGKVGGEDGRARFQLSQRADFLAEAANAETLHRRPVFNTRDEPHARPQDWIRLHVISGDANMMPACTARKVGLVKIALELCIAGLAPAFSIADPVRAFRSVSRDETHKFAIQLESGWTSAYEVIDAYLLAYERAVCMDEAEPEMRDLVLDCRGLLQAVERDTGAAASRIDWAAKRAMLEQFMEAEGAHWHDPIIRSLDLQYHNLDPNEGLYRALLDTGSVEPEPEIVQVLDRLERPVEPTRALARSVAVTKFPQALRSLSWGRMTLETQRGPVEVELAPDKAYPTQLREADSVETFVNMLRGAAQ